MERAVEVCGIKIEWQYYRRGYAFGEVAVVDYGGVFLVFGEGDRLVAVAVDYVQIGGGELLVGYGGELFVGERAAVSGCAVGEAQSVGYFCRAVVLVTADEDVVGGVGIAEGDAVRGLDTVVTASGCDVAAVDGDVAVVGTDAGRPAGSVDIAAVNVDVAVGVQAPCVVVGGGDVDIAAVDDDVAVSGKDSGAPLSVRIDGDVAAVDGDGFCDDAIIVAIVCIDAECARASGLAIDGECLVAVGLAGDAVAVNPALARPDVHRAAVGEDEADVAAEGDGGGVVDVLAHEVPSCGEAGLRAVEGDGLCGMCGAVGINVADFVLLAVAADGGGDGHVAVGGVDGVCVAAECGAVGAKGERVALGGFAAKGAGEGQGEALAVVAHAVIHKAVLGRGSQRGGAHAVAEGDDVGREGTVVGGDVGSLAALAGGDGGAVHGAAVVVVVAEGAVTVPAADGAVVICGFFCGGDVGIGNGAAADGAAVVVADNAADVIVAFDAGVGEVDVVDVGTAAYHAEETLVTIGIAVAGLADADAAYGLVVAIEVALEVAVGVAALVASYGLIVLVVFLGLVLGVGERDVGSELEVLALVVVGGLAVSAVHAVGEQQQLVFVVYHVGVGRVAFVHGCPVDEGEGGADGHVGVGHGECGAVEGACAGGVGVLVALGCAGVAEGEAHFVATAVVEGLAALQASDAVCSDAADGVIRSVAGEGDSVDGNILACGDGVGGLDLGGAEGLGVVAVGDGGAVAAEGGAGIAGAVNDLGLAVGEVGGGVERVGDGDGTGVPAYEAAAVGGGGCACGEQFAVEHAALDVERAIVDNGHETAMRAVAANSAFDGDAAATVLDADRAPHARDKSCRILASGDYSAIHVHVPDGGADGIAEEGVAPFAVVEVEGDGVATAVERAAEVVVVAACHAGDGDVVAEADGLAAEAVPSVVVLQGVAEEVPALGGADDVGVFSRAVHQRVVVVAQEGRNVFIDCHTGVGADVERIAVDGRAVDGVVDPSDGSCWEGDGGPAGVVARTVVGEGGCGAGGDAVVEGQGVGAGGGDRRANGIRIYGTDVACRVEVAAADVGTSTTDVSAYRSFVICVKRGVDDVAVRNRSGLYRANDAADSFIAHAEVRGLDVGIDHRKIPDAAALKKAEQPGHWRRGVHCEADDGVALSVVGAVEWRGVVTVGLAANRLEVACAAHVDVLRLLEGLAAGVVAAVDVGGEVNEVLGVVDFVVAAVVVGQAGDVILRPRRGGGEQGDEQRHCCPRQSE